MSFLGPHSPTLWSEISQAVKECRCTISQGQMSVVGQDLVGVLFLSGTWDAIAKMEDSCARFEDEHKLRFLLHRTEEQGMDAELLPYAVDVVATGRAEVLHALCDFFIRNTVAVLDLHIGSFKAQHTGMGMSSLHISVGLPPQLSIAAIRGEFMELCDRLNVDAAMEPMK